MGFFFSSRRRHTRCALVTGVQTCALPILAFVQGNADRAVGGDHRLAEQPRRLALDVEIFLLLEAEQLGVEARPGSHLAAPDVVREMIEQFEPDIVLGLRLAPRSEEPTSELQSLMRTSYAVFCLKKKQPQI